MKINYYKMLGIAPNATKEEIREIILGFDSAIENNDSELVFNYFCLLDSESKKAYDKELEDGKAEGTTYHDVLGVSYSFSQKDLDIQYKLLCAWNNATLEKINLAFKILTAYRDVYDEKLRKKRQFILEYAKKLRSPVEDAQKILEEHYERLKRNNSEFFIDYNEVLLTDYYQVLGIPYSATQEEIESAYKLCCTLIDATRKKIDKAYTTLTACIDEYPEKVRQGKADKFNYYEGLGVLPSATPEEIQYAFDMSTTWVNDAWKTLEQLEYNLLDHKDEYDEKLRRDSSKSTDSCQDDISKMFTICFENIKSNINKAYDSFENSSISIRTYYGSKPLESNNMVEIIKLLNNEFNKLIMIGEDYPLVVLSYLFDELKSACFVRAGLSNHKATIKLACIINYLPKALCKYTNYDGVIDFLDKMWYFQE